MNSDPPPPLSLYVQFLKDRQTASFNWQHARFIIHNILDKNEGRRIQSVFNSVAILTRV